LYLPTESGSRHNPTNLGFSGKSW